MDELPLNASDMDRTADLVAQCFPDSLFRIAWAYFDGRMELRGMPSDHRIDVFKFTNLEASTHYAQVDTWVGDDSQWDRMLDSYAMANADSPITDETAP